MVYGVCVLGEYYVCFVCLLLRFCELLVQFAIKIDKVQFACVCVWALVVILVWLSEWLCVRVCRTYRFYFLQHFCCCSCCCCCYSWLILPYCIGLPSAADWLCVVWRCTACNTRYIIHCCFDCWPCFFFIFLLRAASSQCRVFHIFLFYKISVLQSDCSSTTTTAFYSLAYF